MSIIGPGGGGVAGPWTNVTIGPKVEQFHLGQVTQVRLEGSSARLRGMLQIRTGQTLESADPLLTVPEGFRPPGICFINTQKGDSFVVLRLYLQTSGILLVEGAGAPTAGAYIPLDGITYNIS